jgi:hypothetical protein
MPAIYRLSPLDHADPSWAASTHKGKCIVRANSEDQARDLAHGAFWPVPSGRVGRAMS